MYRDCFDGGGFGQRQQSGKLRGGARVVEDGERGYVESRVYR